jgi:predicted NAD-dependent protein-ADP-ribosyltransferase YbiA (DUF1768 family)
MAGFLRYPVLNGQNPWAVNFFFDKMASTADAAAGSDFVRERMPLQDLKNALEIMGQSSDGPREELAARWLATAQGDLVIPFYHGHQGPWRQLSNWFISDKWAFYPPVWDKASVSLDFFRANVLPIMVSSSEEAIMLRKAWVMEDATSFNMMLTVVNGNSDGTGAHGPRATKAIGRTIKPWIDERWTKYRPQVALDVSTQKFSSHADMSDLLRSTGRATLARNPGRSSRSAGYSRSDLGHGHCDRRYSPG